VAAILSGFCFWLNVEVAPHAKARVKTLLFEAVKEDPNKFLDPGVVQTQLKDKRIYVRDRKGNTLYGLHIHDVAALDKSFASNFYIYAESALIYVDMETSQIKLKLQSTFALMEDSNGTKIPITVEDVDPVLFSFDDKKKRRMKASAMTNEEIRTYLATDPEISAKDRAKLSNAVTSRQSFSFACLAFALIGVPLGIGARRKDTSTGFILSMAIGMCYFLFHIFAGQIEDDSSDLSTILFWLPNALALIIGLWLFRRARSK
jgi:lipopolysaccharide export system permease protein